MSKSIISNKKECLICHTTVDIHKHHIYFGTSNRKNSEKYGCWCFLCAKHHNMSDEGVHFNEALNSELKQYCQMIFEKSHTREEFRRIFGKSYL